MSLISPETAPRLTLGMSARCTTIVRAVWANEGQSLIVVHGSGMSVWMGGFDARPDHVFSAEAPLRSVAISPLQPLAAIGGHDGRVRLWDTQTWQRDQAMPAQLHTTAVTALAFHPTRPIVAGGDHAGLITQVDLESGRFMKLAGHTKEITSLAYSSDGKMLASGSWDHSARLWNALTGAPLHTLDHPDWVRGLAVTGDQVATACRDGRLRVWPLTSGVPTAEAPAHDGGVDTVALSPAGDLLATGGRDGALRLWHASTLIPAGVIPGAHRRVVLTLAFRPQGDFLISGGGDNHVHLWETTTPNAN